ncbi:hypothetical protein C8R46DRAFT_1270128 [Mycena filopes]|nr:hypothetical protein C8R46DRAFT_1270128 [Mycena filopes]
MAQKTFSEQYSFALGPEVLGTSSLPSLLNWPLKLKLPTDADFASPPPYQGRDTKTKGPEKSLADKESKLELLKKYDTIILLDDSFSMTSQGARPGTDRWHEAGDALTALVKMIVEKNLDPDGIDLYFMNHEKHDTKHLKTAESVTALFKKVEPDGLSTPTEERLFQILSTYIATLECGKIGSDGTPWDKDGNKIKRANVIVITDGEACNPLTADEPAVAIKAAAKRLDKLPNLCPVQVGTDSAKTMMVTNSTHRNDKAATEALRVLDDDLTKSADIRDIVDTTSYQALNPITAKGITNPLTAEGIIKALIGGINRRVDKMRLPLTNQLRVWLEKWCRSDTQL